MQQDMRKTIVVIAGPTASGKSALALAIAQKFDGELIAADSRTVYKGMDIGTAKPSPQEQAAVKHWGLDLIDPSETFSVGDFKVYADQVIKDITDRGKLPIVVGGTGLYVSALLENYGFEKGNAEPQYEALLLIPETDRKALYHRIDERVDVMVRDGLQKEVEDLMRTYGADAPGMSGIGYRQFVDVLNGSESLEQAIDLVKRDSRRYAKRQFTWWRHHGDPIFVKNAEEAIELVHDHMKNRATRG